MLRVKRGFVNEIGMSRKALVVEATLTESCVPLRLYVKPSSQVTLVDIGVGCRTKDYPASGGSDWRIY